MSPGSSKEAVELVGRAASAVEEGRPDQAISDLRRAAELHSEAKAPLDASHCLSQAATISRLAGNLVAAIALGEKAVELAEGDDAFSRSALLELAETAFLGQEPGRAAGYLERALAHLGGAPRELRIGSIMKYGEALFATGDFDGAETQWKAAEALTEGPGERSAVLVRRATILTDAHRPAAPAALLRAKAAAIEAGDPSVLADVALLECAHAIAEDELDVAERAADLARSRALEAGAATTYVSAAAVKAKLCEKRGDLHGAYRSLTVGWVTFADIAGDGLAKATFAPLLEDLRIAWGADVFASIKAEVEAASASD